MPQDPDLYGQRPPKRQKKSTSSTLPSSLAFKSELASLISTSKTPASSIIPSTTTQARPRPSKSKPDIFATVKARRKADKSRANDDKLILRDITTTQDEKNAHLAARRKMEDKARLYAAMKRGDYVPKEGEAAPLVDFDRKWAEKSEEANPDASSSDDDNDDDDDDDNEADNEIVTFTDEFGRARTGTRAELQRLERRLRASQNGTAELERMSARPREPERLIYGDAVQSEAFVAADEAAMEAMARKRDRSLTPPEMKHYDANGEIRTKGVGFFQFSKDEEVRKAEMEALEKERATTKVERAKREEERAVRKREVEERRRVIEERRRAVGEKRAAKMADTFLEGLAADMGDKEEDKEEEGEEEG